MLKKFIFIGLFVFSGTIMIAQNRIITTRDTIYFSYAIKKNLIPDYQTLLNIISDSSYTENEVDAIINNKVKGSKDLRIFVSENAIIEFDLKPGADTSKSLRADKKVIDYLKLFYTNYQRSYENTVTLNVLSISPLKKTSYFYCNVLFECDYKNTTFTGESFKKFSRVAQVKLDYDKKWRPLITTITFPNKIEADTVNLFKEIIKAPYDPEKLFQYYDDEKEQKNLPLTDRINNLILEGDLLFDKEKYEEALNKYLDARKLNYSNKDAAMAIEKVRKIVVSKTASQKEGAQREKRISEMKKEAYLLRDSYRFTDAKILCDSLIKDYNDNDPEIKKLNSELSTITSCFIGIESAMEHNDLKGAVMLCEKNISETINPVYKAELYYHIALAYYSLDKSQLKKIFDNLDQAIILSGKQHKEALKLRALSYMNREGGIVNAITDATQLVSNDPRNADNYFFRGNLYEIDKSYTKAVEDYRQAISLNIKDTMVYQKKSALEFNMGKYDDAIKTASEGIAVTTCYGLLFFNHGVAKNKLNDCQAAGADFRKALACSPDEMVITATKNISEIYNHAGNTAFVKGDYENAIKEFTKSVFIDSSETALFMMARCYLKIQMGDSALHVLNKLIQKNQNFKDVFLLRGITFVSLGKLNEAKEDYETEIKRNRKNADAWYAKGKVELLQNKFDEAAASFEFSATFEPVDSSWCLAAYAYYSNNNFNKAIECAAKATGLNPGMQKAYMLSGKSYYNKKQYTDALKEFEKAVRAGNPDEGLTFAYASALEATNDYLKANQNYDLLAKSNSYQDTALMRSAICLVKTRTPANYPLAIDRLNHYVKNTVNTNSSEVYAWMAYTYLLLDSTEAADQLISKAERVNYNNIMLQYVFACRKTLSHNYAEAFVFLEKSLTDIELPKNYIETEPLFDELRKNQGTKERLIQLIEKYFKEK